MSSPDEALQIIELRGSPREMGRQHGEAVREGVRELSDVRMRLLIAEAAEAGLSCTERQVLELAGRSLAIHRAYAPAVYEEFLGIAAGAGLSPERLLVGNGYTDLRDRLVHGPREADGQGCTACAIRADRSATAGPLVGQSWDMHASAEAFVIAVRRRPAAGPESFCVTTAGCLSLVGVNAEGIAVGNNNLRPTDAVDGVMYLAIIHNALSRRDTAGAVAAIVDCPRMSGHNYYVAGKDGRIVDIETTAGDHHVFAVDGPVYAHTNHYLHERLARLRSEPPQDSTLARLARMEALLASEEGPIGPEDVERFLADREGGEERCICRLGTGDEARTCAVAILAPAERAIYCHKGPPNTAPLARFVVG